MVGKTKAPTKAQQARFRALRELGCIACRIDGRRNPAIDVHHITEGYRLGHDATLPLCTWHHRGLCLPGWPPEAMAEAFGPSLAHQKRAFIDAYGTERALLEAVNERLRLQQQRQSTHTATTKGAA